MEHKRTRDDCSLECPIALRLEELAPDPGLFLHTSYLHGQLHVVRVIIHGFALVSALGWRNEAPRVWAAAYLHDLARTHDGRCHRHGANAVSRLATMPETHALLQRGGLCEADAPALATAVTYHSLPQELPDRHPHYRLTALLKDADALDRVRLGDLNPSYLRLKPTRALIEFAQALHDETQWSLEPGPDLFVRMWPIAQKLHRLHTKRSDIE